MDGGPEFVGNEWEFMLNNWGLKHARILSHTPTANAIIEFSHRSMGQILSAIFDREQPKTVEELDQVVKSALACTMRAMRCASSTLLPQWCCSWSIGFWARYIRKFKG